MVSIKLHHQSKICLQDHVDATGGDGDARDNSFDGRSNTLAVNLWSKGRKGKNEDKALCRHFHSARLNQLRRVVAFPRGTLKEAGGLLKTTAPP